MTRWLAIVLAIALTPACNQQTPESPQTELGNAESFERIVTLAPHLAEFVFAVGAGDKLVGVSAYSDFPPEVAGIPVISDAFTVDQEQLALLEPDLVLAWQSGTPVALVDELRKVGYRVVSVETRNLGDIVNAIRLIGELTGNAAQGEKIAHQLSVDFTSLALANRDKPEISVFYQVSSRPLYTINGAHYISQILGFCRGRNIFDELDELAPTVTVESVVNRDPEVLLAGSIDGSLPFDDWSRWDSMAANRLGNRFVVSADYIGRPSTRLLKAGLEVCAALDKGRTNREVYEDG